jgi:hypothetical protein
MEVKILASDSHDPLLPLMPPEVLKSLLPLQHQLKIPISLTQKDQISSSKSGADELCENSGSWAQLFSFHGSMALKRHVIFPNTQRWNMHQLIAMFKAKNGTKKMTPIQGNFTNSTRFQGLGMVTPGSWLCPLDSLTSSFFFMEGITVFRWTILSTYFLPIWGVLNSSCHFVFSVPFCRHKSLRKLVGFWE